MKIFANVTQEEFRECVDKSSEEGLDLGQVLTKLVQLYVNDEISLAEED